MVSRRKNDHDHDHDRKQTRSRNTVEHVVAFEKKASGFLNLGTTYTKVETTIKNGKVIDVDREKCDTRAEITEAKAHFAQLREESRGRSRGRGKYDSTPAEDNLARARDADARAMKDLEAKYAHTHNRKDAIVIDVGHDGNHDKGATGHGSNEVKQNIPIAAEVAKHADRSGKAVYFTSQHRDYAHNHLSPSERNKFARDVDSRHGKTILISLHSNHGSKRDSGFIIINDIHDLDSKKIAANVDRYMDQTRVLNSSLSDTQKDRCPRARGVLTGYQSNDELIEILVENGFMTNSKDVSRVKNNPEKIGAAIAAGTFGEENPKLLAELKQQLRGGLVEPEGQLAHNAPKNGHVKAGVKVPTHNKS